MAVRVATGELTPPAEALAAWARACAPRGSGAAEAVPLDDALGRLVHAPVRARRSSPAAPEPGPPVRALGEDVAAGELLFAPGHRLGPFDLALAAAAGHAELSVRARPLVTLLSLAGAETNRVMLDAQARAAGFRTAREDTRPDRLGAAVERAAATSDLVLVVASRNDVAAAALRGCGTIVARGVAMRPGRPAVLAVVAGTPVLGCPGHPVSAALAFERLARPLLDRRHEPPRSAQLGAAIDSERGVEEHVRVATGRVAGRRVAVPLRRGAGMLSALARADGIVTLPAGVERLPAGAEVRIEPLRAVAPDRLLIAGPADRALDHLLVACGTAGLEVTACEMPAADAVALVAGRGCHAAWAPDTAADGAIVVVPVAEREVGLAAAAPGALRDPVAHRSDDAAIDAVLRGHAGCVHAGVHAARAAGLATRATGRMRVGLALRRDADRSDPALAALLDLVAGPELAGALAADGQVPTTGPARAA